MAAYRRQLDLAGPLQHQQEPAANHVPQCAVGLFPPQGFAQLPRQFPAAAGGMRRDELSQENDLLTADLLAAVAPRFPHNRSMTGKETERKGFVLFFQLTLRHTGAASVSGLPAANSN